MAAHTFVRNTGSELLTTSTRKKSARRANSPTKYALLESLESRVLLASNPIVAVIDTGAIISNISGNLWINPKENNTTGDNDLNGYANDINGFNFIGFNNNITDTDTLLHGTTMAQTVVASYNSALAAIGGNATVQIMVLRADNTAVPTGAPSIGGGTWTYDATTGTGVYQLNNLPGVNNIANGSSWTWTGPGTSTGPATSTTQTGVWVWKTVGPSPVNTASSEPQPGTPGSANWVFNAATGTWVYATTANTPTTYNGGGYTNTTGSWLWSNPTAGQNPDPSVLGEWTWTGANLPSPAAFTSTGLTPNAGPGKGTFVWNSTTLSWSWVTGGGNSVVAGNEMGQGPIYSVVEALNYAAFQKAVRGVNIVAATINRGALMSNAPYADRDINALKAAIDNATRRGIAVIIGAGNGTSNNDVVVNFPPNLAYNNELLLSTASSDGTGGLLTFSNFGKANVEYATPTGTLGTGTDFSAAQLAGIYAALKVANPSASSGSIVTALTKGSVPSTALSTTISSGGEVDVTRANNILQGAADKPLQYSVDVVSPNQISGWAYDGNLGSNPVTLKLYVDNVLVSTTLANQARSDLTNLPENTHAFNIKPPSLTGTHTYALYASSVTVNPNTGVATTTDVPISVRVLNAEVAAIGYLDGVTFSGGIGTASGWAYDFNSGTAPINVRIDVDGITVGTTSAALTRNDLIDYEPVGSADHGFSFSLGALAQGTHRVDAYAIDTPSSTPRLIGTKIVNVNNNGPILAYDSETDVALTGYVYDDDDRTRSVRLEVQIDGKTSSFVADILRTDIFGDPAESAHGFVILLPDNSAAYTLRIYAYDINTGVKTLVDQRDVPARKNPFGSLDVASGTTFAGWVGDPEAPNSLVQFKLEVDGKILLVDTADLVRTDLLAVLPTANHAFNITAPQFTAGNHTAKLWAVNSSNGASVLIATKNFTVANGANALPTGTVTAFTPTAVGGYAADPSSPGANVMIRVLVDGVTAVDQLADIPRSDSNKGFYIALPGLSNGSHLVQVFALDTTNSTPTLLHTGYVRQGIPLGSIDNADNATITGWATTFTGDTSPILRLKVGSEFFGGPLSPNTTRLDGRPGFTFNGIPVASGSSTVTEFYVWDPVAAENVQVGISTIASNLAPTAYLDVINPGNNGNFFGWTVDVNSPSIPLNFVVSVDGVIIDFGTANYSRPDVGAIYGNNNLGLNYTLPSVILFGTRRVSIGVLDSQTGVITNIFDQTLLFS